MKSHSVAPALVAGVLMLATATPAVAGGSRLTAEVEAFGGATNANELLDRSTPLFSGGVGGSLRAPIAGPLVAQVDALFGGQRGENGGAGALHLAMELPGGWHAGIYGDYSQMGVPGKRTSLLRPGPAQFTYESPASWHLAGEAGFTHGIFTLEAVVGIERVEHTVTFGGPIIATVPGPCGFFQSPTCRVRYDLVNQYGRDLHVFDMADLRVQPGGGWSAFAGHRYVGGRHTAALGIDRDCGSGLTLFAEARVGDEVYRAAWLGVRVRFGTRGRQAMFTSRLKDDLFVTTNTLQRAGTAFFISPTPGSPST